jgi:hypothetical protein
MLWRSLAEERRFYISEVESSGKALASHEEISFFKLTFFD